MPERWEGELRKLRAVDAPSDLPDRAHRRAPHVPPQHSTTTRVVTVVVAFAVLAGGSWMAIRSFAPGEKKEPRAETEIGEVVVDCKAGATTITPAEVVASRSGVHLAVRSDRPWPFLDIEDELPGKGRYDIGMDFGDLSRGVDLALPPGAYHIACDSIEQAPLEGDPVTEDAGDEASSTLAPEPVEPTPATLTVIDPNGYYTDFAPMTCDTRRIADQAEKLSVPDVITQVIPRWLPGVLPTDEIVAVGYQGQAGFRGTERSAIIRRDGQTVAHLTLDTSWISGEVCVDSDIRDSYTVGSPFDHPPAARELYSVWKTVGNPDLPLASTVEVPGYAGCNPYEVADCAPIWISHAADEAADGHTLRDAEGVEFCSVEQGWDDCTLSWFDDPRVAWMSNGDAERFVEAFGCGTRYERMCHDLPVLSDVAPSSPVAPEDAPLEVQVTCTGTTPTLSSSGVRAQGDGVVLTAEADDPDTFLHFRAEDDAHLQGLSSIKVTSVPRHVGIDLPPGTYRVYCTPAISEGRPDPSWQAESLTVVDPDGVYVSFDDLECRNYDQLTALLGPSEPGGDVIEGSIDDVVREAYEIAPGDVVQPVGYPDHAYPESGLARKAVLLRDGAVIARFEEQPPWATAFSCAGEDPVSIRKR